MSTPASVAKHPLHPILVSVPIGLWVFSLVADLIFHLGWGEPVWKDVAFYAIGGGIVGALVAAVPGFIDFLSITVANVRAIGVYHMVANLIALGIFAVSFWLRWAGTAGFLPVGVSLVGLVFLGLAGWLGGELVFVHQMGVTPAEEKESPKRSSDRRVA